MKKAIILILLLSGVFQAQKMSAFAQTAQFMGFQKLVFYNWQKMNEYVLVAHSISTATNRNNLDRQNLHVLLEMVDGKKVEVNNADLIIANLGDMVYEGAQKYTLFRFNMVIDNSGSIDDYSLQIIENAITKFIEKMPLSFQAQIIKFSSTVKSPSRFTNDKSEVIQAVRDPFLRENTALFDAIAAGIQELKFSGDDVPFKFSVVFTDGWENASAKYPSDQADNFKTAIRNECMNNYIPLFVIGVTGEIDEPFLRDLTQIGTYQGQSVSLFMPIQNIPDIDATFDQILALINETYIFRIPAVSSFANLRTIYLVKKTAGGNTETIQSFPVQ